MRHFFKYFLGVVVLCVATAQAAKIESLSFPDKVSVDKQPLALNGLGLRTATIFKVNVYAAGLYLKNKADSTLAVLSSPFPKQLQMQFMRDVSAKDIRNAWDNSVKENCEADCERNTALVDVLKSFMVDMKKGDQMAYTFRKGSVEVWVNGEKRGEISDAHFPSVLLSTWIGKKPPTEALKEGLLGVKGS